MSCDHPGTTVPKPDQSLLQPPIQPLVGYRAAAAAIHWSESTLRRSVRSGKGGIPYYGSGRLVRFDVLELRAWLRSMHEDVREKCLAAHSGGDTA